jgi:hypothetical protein
MFPSLTSSVSPSSSGRSRLSSLKLFIRQLAWVFHQPADSHNEFSQKYSLIDPRIDISVGVMTQMNRNCDTAFCLLMQSTFIVLSISFSHSTVIQKIPVLRLFVFFSSSNSSISGFKPRIFFDPPSPQSNRQSVPVQLGWHFLNFLRDRIEKTTLSFLKLEVWRDKEWFIADLFRIENVELYGPKSARTVT